MLSLQQAEHTRARASLGLLIDSLRSQQVEVERARRDYREKVLALLVGGAVLALLFGFLARMSAAFAVITALVVIATGLGLAAFARLDPASAAGAEARRIARLIAETEAQLAELASPAAPDV